MLEIKNITKIYKTEGFTQTALDKVSMNFRESEFAAILGPSGSGKTTLLNIIGGLDKYTHGDLIINGVSTKKFSDRDWDSYRNHRVGFVFQSYNLISHQTILKNVELALTLSGISKDERRKRAVDALDKVGLKNHMNKKPNQLSGGQMQRVAIARALVNNPEIVLADEPTGALDSETSVQIMDILKEISKTRLVIMVTHNPELAEEYASRIINIKDGEVLSDSNPFNGKEKTKEEQKDKRKKTKMSFWTALSLSFNNLMTKKGRTILVSAAGSIGIIGIALILAVSTGFQNYIDSIQEDTLTSYPLTIMQEATDITSVLLSMQSGGGNNTGENEVKEEQYITSMLSSVSTNDLKSFKKYLEKNYDKVDNDLSNVVYSYSIDPSIYTIDATNKLAKVNPSNLFTSMMGSSSLLSSYSSMTSIYSQMVDDLSEIKSSYDVLAGTWPTNYDEMVIVLSEPNSISDLLVYSLGLRDTNELTELVTKIMSGEAVDINNEPMSFTYEDLLNIDLRLIMPTDTYKYNSNYDVYEDMSENDEYMNNLYNNATKLKIVGVVTAKAGSSSQALSPGVAYTSSLIDYIIENASKSDIVKKQLNNKKIDVFSGNDFEKENNYDFSFSDLVAVDSKKLQSAFGIKLDQGMMEKETKKYMENIIKNINLDISDAQDAYRSTLSNLAEGLFQNINREFGEEEVSTIVEEFMILDSTINSLKELENNYLIPADTLSNTYKGLLNGLLNAYVNVYKDISDIISINNEIKAEVINNYLSSGVIISTIDTLASASQEAKIKASVLSEVTNLTSYLTKTVASSFNVDEEKIVSAFSLNFTEDELMRVVSAMTSKSDKTAMSNLISLGYQDKEEPTYIAFYFNSFEGKEHFLEFINDYNNKVEEDSKINYTDTTGILMSSVKTIVNAVSYVLIAFVSISLVVSSIMIGVITYISVYERTKEIGILRAIGASKRNISSIFNAETFIIGLLSGLIGIGVSYICIPVINSILHQFTGNIPLSASLEVMNALYLVLLAIVLTLIGGLIPAKSASKKDPVEALRSE